MKKYRTVLSAHLSELEAQVTQHLNEGWQLAGGISMAYQHEHSEGRHVPGHLTYIQALIKEEVKSAS